MVITHLKKGEHDLSQPERLSSCGRPVPWMHVALLDEDSQPVGAGESGEICMRGPLRDERATRICPTRPPSAGAATGCTPATSAASRTRTASGTSSTAPRTW